MARITEQPKLLKNEISMNYENALSQIAGFMSIKEVQKSLFIKNYVFL